MEKLFKKELKAFGKRLKSIRKAKGLSQLDLEIESGINRTEISRMENGQRNIEFYTIVKLANALGIPVKDLFS
jgi:HTH-type transcriptional regulator, competence development regulator